MRSIQTLLFGAGIVTALGYGSASALAKPITERARAICPFQRTEANCARCCQGMGTNVYSFDPDTGECLCEI